MHRKGDVSILGMKFEGCRKAAQKDGRCFRRVDEGAEFFMRKWLETERRKRPGGGGRGGGEGGEGGRGERGGGREASCPSD